MPHNRELMRVFKDVDLVEQLGSGMSRILHTYDQSIFDISDNFIRAIFSFTENLDHDGTINGIINEIEKDQIVR